MCDGYLYNWRGKFAKFKKMQEKGTYICVDCIKDSEGGDTGE